MNNDRRKYIMQIIEALAKAKDNLESVKDGEQESYDNVPENLKGTERADNIESNLEELDETIDLCSEAISRLEDLL